MKKLIFILTLFPILAFADETPILTLLKKQPGTSMVHNKKTLESPESINLMKVLDSNYQEVIQENPAEIQEELNKYFLPYVSVKLGYGKYKTKASVLFAIAPFDNQKDDYSAGTMAMSLAFGVHINDFRFELEGKADTGSKDKKLFGYDTINGKLYTAAVIGNVYYDIPLKSKFRPYVGAGLGMGCVKGELYDLSESTTNFAWQLMAGVGYDLTEHWKLDLGYNYGSYGDLTIGEKADTKVQLKDIEGHNITLGTRYEF